MPIRVIVTDADGKAVSGRGVHVEMQKMNFTSATQEVEGGENAQQAIEYETVATADTTSSNGPVTVQLAPRDAGAYRVRSQFCRRAGRREFDRHASLRVRPRPSRLGADRSECRRGQTRQKVSTRIGDTATAMIASPLRRRRRLPRGRARRHDLPARRCTACTVAVHYTFQRYARDAA